MSASISLGRRPRLNVALTNAVPHCRAVKDQTPRSLRPKTSPSAKYRVVSPSLKRRDHNAADRSQRTWIPRGEFVYHPLGIT